METTVERTGDDVLDIDPQAGDTEPAGDPSPDPKPKEKNPADDSLREMRRALKETREALKQTNDTARFWMEQARSTGKKAEPAEEAAPAVSVDLVEAITNGDTKAIAKAMRELGFVSAKEVQQAIGSTRRQMTDEQKLYEKFPDLEDDKSELFQRTAQIFNDLASDPHMKNSPRLAEVAAKLAAKELDDEPAARRRPAREEADEDFDEDEEEERVQRVARQSGSRGRATARRGDERGASQELDSMQKSIVAKLKAAGADISEEGYRKRAQSGVRMAGLPTRRPRY